MENQTTNPARPNAMLKFALDAVEHGYVWINQRMVAVTGYSFRNE